MLNRVKSWLENHQVENNGLIERIRDSLNRYGAKLSDLRTMLQQATAQAKQATGLNRENEKDLASIKVRLQLGSAR